MPERIISGIVLDEHVQYSLEEVCQVCGRQPEWVVELVEHGVLQPKGHEKDLWRFAGSCMHTAMKATRMQEDLGLNSPGVALVLELLREIETLRAQLGPSGSSND